MRIALVVLQVGIRQGVLVGEGFLSVHVFIVLFGMSWCQPSVCRAKAANVPPAQERVEKVRLDPSAMHRIDQRARDNSFSVRVRMRAPLFDSEYLMTFTQ